MRRALRMLLRLYPRRWRQRYEDEVLALLEERSPRPGDLVDLIAWSLRAHLGSRPIELLGGAFAVIERSSAHATRLALVGLLVLLPTLILIVLSILKYVLGIPAPFDALEPVVTPLVTHPIGETVVTIAPYIALLLAVVPTVRVDAGWRRSMLAGSIGFSAPAASILVAAASATVAVVMILYWVAENV
jgi:hypothetical protein